MAGPNDHSEPEDPETALRLARAAFIDGFHSTCVEIERALTASDPQALRSARHRAHRIAGVAAMVGFPGVGAHAQDLEEALRAAADGGDVSPIGATLDAMRRTFDSESG